jgi:septal ring factor EnvC (AmiA/AmiB activator)
MSRGVQRSVEQRIAVIEEKKSKLQSKIESYKSQIAKLDSDIKDLQDTQKQKEFEDLVKIIQESGKSKEEILIALNLNKQ